MNAADFFLRGSGSATIGWRECASFKKRTGRPFGVYGVTYGLDDKQVKATLSNAAFVYFRNSISLALAKEEGIKAPVMEFGSDAVFAPDVLDEECATEFLKKIGLENGQFIVALSK